MIALAKTSNAIIERYSLLYLPKEVPSKLEKEFKELSVSSENDSGKSLSKPSNN